MTKRNIAIANFNPAIVEESHWPRFTGWKQVSLPDQPSGLFGIVDAGTRMHRFFPDTTIEEVLTEKLVYGYHTYVRSVPLNVEFFEHGEGGEIIMPPAPTVDFTVKWLPPYQYIDNNDVEWDVYVVITGTGIHIKHDVTNEFYADGYWDMGIWKPKPAIGEEWNDTKSIEQATINYVVKSGYPAMYYSYSDTKEAGKVVYVEKDVYQEIPGYRN